MKLEELLQQVITYNIEMSELEDQIDNLQAHEHELAIKLSRMIELLPDVNRHVIEQIETLTPDAVGVYRVGEHYVHILENRDIFVGEKTTFGLLNFEVEMMPGCKDSFLDQV